MNIGIFMSGVLVAEIEGVLRDGSTVDGRVVWHNFPKGLIDLLDEYSSALEDLSLHNWDRYQQDVQNYGLTARGEGIDGPVEDLQVFRNGASLARIGHN
jgi:hypothetical protein